MAEKQTTEAAAVTPASPSYYGGYSFSPSVNSVTSDFFLGRRIPAQGGNIFSLMRNNIRQSYTPDIFANTSVFAGRVIAIVDPLSPEFVSKANNVFSNVYNFYRKVLLDPQMQLPILFKVVVPGVTDMIPPPNVSGITQSYLNEGLISSKDDFLADQHPTFVSVNNDLGKVLPGSWVTVQFGNMYKMFSDGPQAAGKCLGVIGDMGLGGECFLKWKYGANAPGGDTQAADSIEANSKEGVSLNRDNAKNIVLLGSLEVQGENTLGQQLVDAYTSAGHVFYTKGAGTYDVDRKIIVPQENSLEKYIEEIDKVIRPTKARGVIVQFQDIFKNQNRPSVATDQTALEGLVIDTIQTFITDVRDKVGAAPIALLGSYKTGPMIGDLTNEMIESIVTNKLGSSAGKVGFFSPVKPKKMQHLRVSIMDFISSVGTSGKPRPVKTPPPEGKKKEVIKLPAKVQKILAELDAAGLKMFAQIEKIVGSITAADALKKVAEGMGWDTSDTPSVGVGGDHWSTLLTWKADEGGTFAHIFSDGAEMKEKYIAIAKAFGLTDAEAQGADIPRTVELLIRDAQAVYEGKAPPSGREVPGAQKGDSPNVQNAPPATDPCPPGTFGQGFGDFDEGSYPDKNNPRKHSHGNDTGGTLPYLKNASTEMEMVHDNRNDFWWAGGIETPQRVTDPLQELAASALSKKKNRNGKLTVGTGPMEDKFRTEAFGKITIKWLGGRNATVGRRAYPAWALAHAELVKAGYEDWKWDEDGGYTSTYQWLNYIQQTDGTYQYGKEGGGKRVGSHGNSTQPGIHGLSHHSALAMDFRVAPNWFTSKRMKPGPKGAGWWTGKGARGGPTDPATEPGIKWWKKEYGVDIPNLATMGNHPTENKPYSLMVTCLPAKVVKIMKKYGFRWGGDYGSHKSKAKTDAMHFEFFGDPRVAAQMAKDKNVPNIIVSQVPKTPPKT